MRFKLVSLFFIASCLPALADPLPAQGNGVIVSGRAQIERSAQGTNIVIDAGRGPAVTGFIPFGNEGAFPDLTGLDGRQVTISGVIYWYGAPKITLTDPRQLSLGERAASGPVPDFCAFRRIASSSGTRATP